ncbi:MAG: hypothetical protein ACI8UO_003938 [Verrucomicrobiales bacterium]|jgi:hypothetical protein
MSDDDYVKEQVALREAEMEAEHAAAIAEAEAQREAAMAEAKAKMECEIAEAEARQDVAMAELEDAQEARREEELNRLSDLGGFEEILTKLFGDAPEIEALHLGRMREFANHDDPEIAKVGAAELEVGKARLELVERVAAFWERRKSFGPVRAWELIHREFLGRSCEMAIFSELRAPGFGPDNPESRRRFAELALDLRDLIHAD